MMTRRLGFPFAFALCALCVLSGCDDECKKGKSECLSENLIRTCVAGEDENTWFVHQCGDDEVCAPDAVSSQSDTDGGASGFGAACRGTCDLGESECVSPALARYCVNGKVWQLDACNVGEECVGGSCQVGTDGGVRACVPGTRACASELVEKICDGDGTSWVERACPSSQICVGKQCMPDPRASCDEGNRCLDNKTSIRCLGRDRGFELVPCPDDTWCEFGSCRGPNCSLGSSCANLNQIRECSDGVNFVDTQCGANEVCRESGDTASCEPRTCVVGTTVCGDPEDPSADDTKSYSQCVIGPNSGVPEWLRGQCTGNLLCDPAFLGTGNPCRQSCTPGAETCAADPTTGIADGYRVCQEDGTFGAVQSCNGSGAPRLQCALQPDGLASDLPKHVCAEPVCAYLFNNVGFGGGVCEQADLRQCNADGTLATAAPCETGFCRSLAVSARADGRVPGTCDGATRCAEGAERCIDDGSVSTPLFQTCDNGEWSSEFSTCADDTTCLDWIDYQGVSRKLCDADCVPGRHQCNEAGELETCGESGKWGGATACTLGRCQATGANDAACVLDCVPGEPLCTGTTVLSSDNTSAGTTMEIICASDGTLTATPTACEAGETCRVTATGIVLGCVACVGSNAPGGNASGLVDSRCAPGAASSVQSCAADNTWGAARACGGGKTCVGPSGPTCGSCLSATGSLVTCTETAIDDSQVCGGCFVPTDDAGSSQPIANCTQTAIQGVDPSATCASLFGGGPTSWGGFADCCDGDSGAYLLTTNETCSTMGYGIPTTWGGEPDCCSSYLLPAGGPAFAYCSD